MYSITTQRSPLTRKLSMKLTTFLCREAFMTRISLMIKSWDKTALRRNEDVKERQAHLLGLLLEVHLLDRDREVCTDLVRRVNTTRSTGSQN